MDILTSMVSFEVWHIQLCMYFILHYFMAPAVYFILHLTKAHKVPTCLNDVQYDQGAMELSIQQTTGFIYHSLPWRAHRGQAWQHYHALTCNFILSCLCNTVLWNGWMHAHLILCEQKTVLSVYMILHVIYVYVAFYQINQSVNCTD